MNAPEEELIIDHDIKCNRCQNVMDMYDEKATIDNDGCALDEDNIMIIEWKPTDCRSVTFFVCGKCKTIKVTCNKCSDMCWFIGHMGFHRDGSQWGKDNAKGSQPTELKSNSKILDATKPRYSVAFDAKTSFNVSDWMPTGPDGTHKHFWHCSECDKLYAFSQ